MMLEVDGLNSELEPAEEICRSLLNGIGNQTFNLENVGSSPIYGTNMRIKECKHLTILINNNRAKLFGRIPRHVAIHIVRKINVRVSKLSKLFEEY